MVDNAAQLRFSGLIIIVLVYNGLALKKDFGCTEWSDWTDTDSLCQRERNRTGCKINVEQEVDSKCVITSTPPPPVSCGEWSKWTECDESCDRERYKLLCAYIIEVEKCTNCVRKEEENCGEWTLWDCDKKLCEGIRTRRCEDEYKQQTQKCGDCGSGKGEQDSKSQDQILTSESKEESEEESEEANNNLLFAGGMIALVLLGGSLGGHFYQKMKVKKEEDIVFEPEDEDQLEKISFEEDDISENSEEKMDFSAEDWAKLS